MINLRALIDREYTQKGKTIAEARREVASRYSVCEDSFDAARAGWRVTPETAHNLSLWAQHEHGETLDTGALERGRKKPKKPKNKKAAGAV